MDKKKLRYTILKMIDDGDYENLSAEYFKVDKLEFDQAVGYLDDNNYLKDYMHSMSGHEFDENVVLTSEGEIFLKENSKFIKGYKLAKEVRDWIPFFKS